jgi:hypothetical protein
MTTSRFALNQRPIVAQPLDESYRFITLTQGQIAIVDADDFERLVRWPWYAMWNPHTKGFRAARTIAKRPRYMHEEVLGVKPVDHWNHDELDNRKKNLRPCSAAQNCRNQGSRNGTSKFKGVAREAGKWRAYIKVDYKRIHIGMFESEESAARAYDESAKKLHSDFAFLNFPVVHPPTLPPGCRKVPQNSTAAKIDR